VGDSDGLKLQKTGRAATRRPFCLLDRGPEAGSDHRWHYPGPTLQALDVSTATMNRSKTFEKRLFALTERRQQVAIFAAHGLSNRAIAEKLSLSEGTVKIHLHATYKKLDVHSRIELANALTDRSGSKANSL
jgi:ATP/maltotriose-dependent transcriptional regulator MalT